MRHVRHLVEAPHHEAVGIVLGEAHLLEDDLALGVELVLIEARVDSDVGEQLHAGPHVLGRQDHVEVGVVVRGESIARSAQTFDERVDRARGPRRRALEEHVLEVVRESELVGRLVAPAHAHPELERHHVAGAVLLSDQHDAVGQHHARGPARARRRAAGAAAHLVSAAGEEDERQDEGHARHH